MADSGGIVALLFTDIVGSTSIYDRLGDQRADALRRAHFVRLRAALEAHGGREVKNLGDGLMVVFSSAVAAVDAAVEMQRGAAADARADEHRPEVRVGLHAGEPLTDDDDFFGVSVNIAKRLCDAAAPGQILASDLVRALVSPRLRTGLTSIGPIALKGIEEEVHAYDVAWAPAESEGAAVLPPLLALSADSPFVGRTRELDRLLFLWKQAMAGERSVALVSGEPGIGKTRLVQELARRVVEGPALVLAGRTDAELVRPLEPFAEALREAARTWPDDVRSTLAATSVEPLLRLGGRPTDVADTERSSLFDSVADVVRAAQERSPVLLVLDDLHWADETTLLLLRHLLRAHLPRLLVVVTYRDTELSRTHPLAKVLADLRRERGVERLALHGLGSDSVRALLGGEEAATALDDLAGRVAEETEGNAFYVTEVIRHLVEIGHLRERDGAWEVAGTLESIDVPEGIREVIGRRLTRLSDACNDVLAVAAVVGRDFPIRVVADVAGITFDAALDAVEEAMEAHVVEEASGAAGSFMFSHALIRETLYAEQTTVRKLRLHRRIGEVLRTSGGSLAEIAHHLLEAGPAGSERAGGEAAVAAVHDARYRLAAFEDAAALSRRALAVLGDKEPDLRCDLLTVLGDVTLCVGDAVGFDHLDEAVALARQLDDPFRIARAVTFAVRAGSATAAMERYVEASEEAIRLLPDGASDIRTRLRSVLALGGWLDDPELPDVLAEAMASGDDEAIAYATLAVADRHLAANEPIQAKSTLDAAVDLVNDRMEEGALVFDERYFEIAVLVGDREVAERVADRVKEGSERLKLPLWGDPMMRAALSLLDGRLEEADAWVQRVMGHRGALTFAGPTLAALAIERCQCEAFVPVLEAQVDQTGDAGWSAALALFLIESGRPDEARPRLEAALRSAVPNLGWRVTMAVLAEAASILGDAKVAAAVREELEPLRGWMVMATGLCLGAVERPLGMCARTTGDLDAAVALLDEAVTRNHSFGTALWAAHSEVDLAMTLLLRRAAGDEQRAAHLLEAAASTADRLGLVRVARRAEAALGGGRLRPSSEPAGGGGSGGLVG